MKVKRLKMTSFRGISDLTLDFQTEEPNVLIGINGVGKSSILDCLAIVFCPLIELIRLNPDYYKFLERKSIVPSFTWLDIKNGCNNIRTEITISGDGFPEVSWSIITTYQERHIETNVDIIQLKAFSENIHNQLKINPNATVPLVVYYPVNRAVLDIRLELPNQHPLTGILDEETDDEGDLQPQFPSLSAKRVIYPVDVIDQIDAYAQALTEKQIGYVRFFQWFRTLEDVENEERRDNPDYRDRQLEAVRQAISSLMPGFSNLRVRRSPLRMTAKKQGQELIVNQLSDGEKGLLAMVGDLARRLAIANPGLPNPLQGEGVVLIDEIELHLHPKWQREIIPALTRTFPNCQFIVTTHSPQVISEVKPNGIYILEATSEGVVAKRPESSYGRDSNRILEDLMGVPARPQEFKDDLLELFRLIDKGDLDGARQLRQQIADEIGADEPELVKASVSIRRKEILSR
ncbi:MULTISPECIES: AAA family ATPase [Cyanophyceae]|uniref:AAA family ATPase n=1 Tax=Cyanophyceae TaxID=3028117 RepID=UPI0016883E17|nr:AAA family ATPase [Trichocoleus sp. FACHB-40]MBD2003991.1 AAA family ATPase [Trichocoleus sp. FACHB-40]